MDGKDLYVWGGSYGVSKALPQKIALSNDEKVVCVGFGQWFMGILTEPNEECKESEYVLKDGEEVSIDDAENKRAHEIFVRNAQLFGDNEWQQIKKQAKHVLFPYFGQEFVDNLVMNDEKTMIELIKYSEIDSVHYSDILSAEYFLYSDIWQQTTVKNKEAFMKKAKK